MIKNKTRKATNARNSSHTCLGTYPPSTEPMRRSSLSIEVYKKIKMKREKIIQKL